ncbi:MAG TPA: DUF4160 domain-containing protein [Bryobacteraceae bacterium]|nr:DUF4160 domain-containing protein [Bryobacteraceae bacterium]
MPEISRFLGIVIAMFYNDHEPPHFHVCYGERRVIVAIDTLVLLGMEWAALHKTELTENWGRARRQVPLDAVAPLE